MKNNNFFFFFTGNLDDPDPNMVPAPIKICNKTLEQIKEFRTCIQIVGILCNNALTERHWDEMSEICGFDITPGIEKKKQTLWNLKLKKL